MFHCSKLPFLGWRSADFLQGFFRPKCLQEQLKHVRSSTKISMVFTYTIQQILVKIMSCNTRCCPTRHKNRIKFFMKSVSCCATTCLTTSLSMYVNRPLRFKMCQDFYCFKNTKMIWLKKTTYVRYIFAPAKC
jgi:hypothetical protein